PPDIGETQPETALQYHLIACPLGDAEVRQRLDRPIATFAQHRDGKPEIGRLCGEGDTKPDIARLGKCPIERGAKVADLPGVLTAPVTCRPRRSFGFGFAEQVAMVFGMQPPDRT